ncbi:hypothetical protein GYMLUDRAFT_492681 [Collybiopsis luxurians FD-317 M1]|uniref:Uncharacterized protein n=1 Tax=Collybiopsis luxurians FD-317 M1 TaxID=944289 RepID=A0A0D0CTT0_9AGAR|nr:hypothetical protein GYMLUDRAFT_492681 [Collybiopsis luxurians FD-317 M1]
MVAGTQVMFSQSNPYKPGMMKYVALSLYRARRRSDLEGVSILFTIWTFFRVDLFVIFFFLLKESPLFRQV